MPLDDHHDDHHDHDNNHPNHHYRTYLHTLVHGAPIAAEDLAVVPLLLPDDTPPPTPAFRSLADALEVDDAFIDEVDEAGTVGTISIALKKGAPVLLLDGEELLGAKQNRVLNSSVLVGAQSTVALPVSCIEAGRWARRTRGFRSSRRSVPVSIKSRKMYRVSASVSRSERVEGVPSHVSYDADQGQVWREVDEALGRHRVVSRSACLSDLLDHSEAPGPDAGDDQAVSFEYARREALRSAAAPSERQVGAAFFAAGHLLGVEVFGHPATLRAQWDSLTSSYALDVDFAVRQTPRRLVSDLSLTLARIAAELGEPNPSPGQGEDRRLIRDEPDGAQLIAAALVADQHLVHLSAHVLAAPAGEVDLDDW